MTARPALAAEKSARMRLMQNCNWHSSGHAERAERHGVLSPSRAPPPLPKDRLSAIGQMSSIILRRPGVYASSLKLARHLPDGAGANRRRRTQPLYISASGTSLCWHLRQPHPTRQGRTGYAPAEWRSALGPQTGEALTAPICQRARRRMGPSSNQICRACPKGQVAGGVSRLARLE